jgi:cytochrome c oxidase cbb3-type subunit 3
MSSPCRTPDRRRAAAALLATLAVAGCSRTGAAPLPGTAPAGAMAEEATPMTAVSSLVPGDAPTAPPDPRGAIYQGVPDQVAAGQQYFTWYNCNGCHFAGGGGIGPPLMDDKWIYGGNIEQIYRSIADGRPNGMPTWRGKIPDAQIWQLAAYVKSLSNPETLAAQAKVKTPLEPAAVSDPHLDPKMAQ